MSKEKTKAPYTGQVEPEHSDKIRAYIEQKKAETGISKRRIFTELILKGIRS